MSRSITDGGLVHTMFLHRNIVAMFFWGVEVSITASVRPEPGRCMQAPIFNLLNIHDRKSFGKPIDDRLGMRTKDLRAWVH
jgi:hypothetical protein